MKKTSRDSLDAYYREAESWASDRQDLLRASRRNAWIVAAAAGTVSASGPYGGLGNRVVIDHGAGITTTYAHIADGGLAVTPGQVVAAGEAIALSGSTGVSTGCHLHFEVALDGVRTDPLPFLAARGVAVG